ncbi:TIGR04222 domain-containing membrane protein [Labilibacter marinus]|uniref:TIGR04222 domain-containing membrane protein n=1 Tax=Labilibacter marinus TaxID=1477105 RepID=UPI00094FCB58|nr:TIGR04222 domain-containing membrane protein [Labilibacter marinus]
MQSIIETLINMPGPWFLLWFGLYAIAIILAVSSLIKNNDPTSKLEIPEPTSLDALDIAILRKGVRGAIVHSIFNLWRKKVIQINGKFLSMQTINPNAKGLNKVEEAICKLSEKPLLFKNILQKKTMPSLEVLIEENKKQLEKKKLTPNDDLKKWVERWFTLGILLIYIPGSLKLFLGISRDKPVLFLVLLLIVIGFIAVLIIRPNKVRITTLGRKFIERCKDRFEWIKTSTEGEALLEQDNLLYGVAAFGVAAIATGGLMGVIEDPAAFDKKATAMTAGFGCASCGGGCTSSGCSGGGGCSSGCGGGGCGGGCGGCGG